MEGSGGVETTVIASVGSCNGTERRQKRKGALGRGYESQVKEDGDGSS